MAEEINEAALREVVKEMASYRPNLSEARIRQIIEEYLRSGKRDPLAESSQDVAWGYDRALRELKDKDY